VGRIARQTTLATHHNAPRTTTTPEASDQQQKRSGLNARRTAPASPSRSLFVAPLDLTAASRARNAGLAPPVADSNHRHLAAQAGFGFASRSQASGLRIPTRAALVGHGQFTSSLRGCPCFGDHALELSLRDRLRFGLAGCDPGSREPAVRGDPNAPCPIAVVERRDVPPSSISYVHISYVHGTHATASAIPRRRTAQAATVNRIRTEREGLSIYPPDPRVLTERPDCPVYPPGHRSLDRFRRTRLPRPSQHRQLRRRLHVHDGHRQQRRDVYTDE
jgi:hypothetical protein